MILFQALHSTITNWPSRRKYYNIQNIIYIIYINNINNIIYINIILLYSVLLDDIIAMKLILNKSPEYIELVKNYDAEAEKKAK